MSDLITTVGTGNNQSVIEKELEWTIETDFQKLPQKEKDFFGRVYVIEFENNLIKIGCTSDLKRRMMNLSTYIGAYGGNKIKKIAYTEPHVDYDENEKELHKIFKHRRKGNLELFDVSFEEISKISLIGNMSSFQREEKRKQFDKSIKKFIAGEISVDSFLQKLIEDPNSLGCEIIEKINEYEEKIYKLDLILQEIDYFVENHELIKDMWKDENFRNEFISIFSYFK